MKAVLNYAPTIADHQLLIARFGPSLIKFGSIQKPFSMLLLRIDIVIKGSFQFRAIQSKSVFVGNVILIRMKKNTNKKLSMLIQISCSMMLYFFNDNYSLISFSDLILFKKTIVPNLPTEAKTPASE